MLSELVRSTAGDPAVKKRPGYTRDIQPLLAAYCYACHGPDYAKREANLRLDRRESAVKEAIVPGIYEPNRLDRIVTVNDREAFACANRLAVEEGLFVGMSSGAAMYAAVEIAKQIKSGTIVVIFPDRGEKYLSTKLFKE